MVEAPWWATGVSFLAGMIVSAVIIFLVLYFSTRD